MLWTSPVVRWCCRVGPVDLLLASREVTDPRARRGRRHDGASAQHSTGPRTEEGKARSSQNADRHGFAGRLLVGLQYGPFADDRSDLQEFVDPVLAELAPCHRVGAS